MRHDILALITYYTEIVVKIENSLINLISPFFVAFIWFIYLMYLFPINQFVLEPSAAQILAYVTINYHVFTSTMQWIEG